MLFALDHIRACAVKHTVFAREGKAMPSALSFEECDVLFDAVRARLRISVGGGPAAAAEPCGPIAAAHGHGATGVGRMGGRKLDDVEVSLCVSQAVGRQLRLRVLHISTQ